MNEISTDRLGKALEKAGLNQSELARRVGLKQPSIGRLISGETKKTGFLHLIARELDTTPEYLTGESDVATVGESRTSFEARPAGNSLISTQSDIAMIPEYDMGFSMGGGSFADHAEQNGVMPFQRKWLKEIMKGAFGDLFVARGDGDSMVPTMMDGDIVLIDRAQQQIVMQDRIWALSYGDLGMIKRVRKTADGGYQINSDNPAVSAIMAYDDEMHVIGRVIWLGRKM